MFGISILRPVYLLFILCAVGIISSNVNASFSIEKSPNDSRHYDYLVLENKLRVLLVSDPNTDKSSASLDVNIGSASDPLGYPGLAHFLEHMLFLGTEKFPEPDAYQKYITQHGGSHNAYTSPENTNYFFDIRPEFLEAALERFSEQFTHPLFNAEYVEREVNAVHSEYTSKVKDDGRRFYSVIKAVLADDHPYSRFSVGNLETLSDKGEEKLRDTLLEFYQKNYSANQMTLVILGKEPLSTLKKWTLAKFSNIPNSNVEFTDISQDFFAEDFLPVKVEAQSIMDKRSMMLAFPIPSSSLHQDSKPVSYLSNLIGHEGKGSLLSALKNENLVDSLSAGAEFDTRVKELFVIRMSLTQFGFDNQERILETIHSYIDLLRKEGLKKLYFDEQKTMLDIAFNYQEKSEPIHFTSKLSRALQFTSAEDILIKPYSLKQFDHELYKTYLSHLNPKNMFVAVSAKAVVGKRFTDWYDAPYNIQELDQNLLDKLIKPKQDNRLSLPEKNIFIPENISIVKTMNTEKPELLLKQLGLEVWHHTDTSFGTPKSNLFLTIRSPEALKSAATLNMTDLLVKLLTDSLNEYSYPAYLAGLHYELYKHMRGVTIKISGYSDRQAQLLSKLLNTVKYAEFSPSRFSIMKERLSRSLSNAKDKKPFQQAISKAQNVVIAPSWNEEERLSALRDIKLEDINQFREDFLSQLDIAVLSSGNLSRASTLNNAQLIQSILLDKATKTEVSRAKIRRIPPKTPWLNTLDTEHSDTGFVHYVQGKTTSHKERAKYLLLTQILSSDYYNQVRTQKQMGYIVFATNFELLEVPAIAFIVQSPSNTGQELYKETKAFIHTSLETVRSTSKADLNKHKSSVVANLLKQDNTLYSRSNRFWKDIDIKNVDFDTKEQLAKEVNSLTLEDMSTLVQNIIADENGVLTVVAKSNSENSQAREPEKTEINSAEGMTNLSTEQWQGFSKF